MFLFLMSMFTGVAVHSHHAKGDKSGARAPGASSTLVREVFDLRLKK